MASPQVENGYTKIANELLRAFMLVNISGAETQVFFTIISKTYGFNKKEDAISLSQFCLCTGMNKQNVCRALSKLITKKMIIRIDNNKPIKYRIQKDYTQWRPLSKQIMLSKQIKNVIQIDNKSLSKQTTTKDKYKDNIQKTSCDEFFNLAKLLSEKMRENDAKAKIPTTRAQWVKWTNDMRLLVQRDGRPFEEVREVLIWSQQDSFWKGNILSASKFRKQYPQLRLKMNEEKKKVKRSEDMTEEEFEEMQQRALKK